MSRSIALLAAAGVCFTSPAWAAPAEFVRNGSFNGIVLLPGANHYVLTDWQVAPEGEHDVGWGYVGSAGADGLVGYADSGCVHEECLTTNAISQQVTTNAGDFYELTFNLRNQFLIGGNPVESDPTPGANDERVRVVWNGVEVFNQLLFGSVWQPFSVNVQAQSGVSDLAFFAWSGHGGMALDEVSLHPAGGGIGAPPDGNPNTVPEPAAWVLMILGFGAAGGSLRRGRTAAA